MSNISKDKFELISENIKNANNFVNNKIQEDVKIVNPFISKHWAPSGEIKSSDRVYFSEENAKRIDWYHYYIDNYVSEQIKYFLYGVLIVKSSIHNNTLGQFSSFLKDETNKFGKFGGRNENDLERILKPIELEIPVYENHNCRVFIDQKDTNIWSKNDVKYDLVYYDPPYNKHPYSIYYFMLDIIAEWNTNENIPNTTRGQPKKWTKSSFIIVLLMQKMHLMN